MPALNATATPSETRTGLRPNASGLWVATAALLTNVLLAQMVVKDWLLSPVQPYPYASSLALTLAACMGLSRALRSVSLAPLLGFGALPWLAREPTFAAAALGGLFVPWLFQASSPPGRRLAGAVALLGFGVGAWGHPPACAALAVGTLTTLAVGEKRFFGRAWPGCAAAAVAIVAVAWLLAMWPGIPSDSAHGWLGAGIGSSLAGAGGARLATELGLGAAYLASFGVTAALAFAVGALAGRRAVVDERLLGMSLGALASLATLARFGPAAFVPGAVGGTLALSLSLGLLQAAFLRDAPRPGRKRPGRLALCSTPLLFAALAMWIWAEGRVGRYFESPRSTREVAFGDLSPALLDATVAMEDGGFYRHRGFDFAALHRALRIDLREGRIVQGGSTITQQLAKNLFLESDRTPWRKLKEAFLTVALERRLTKDRILEAYVNGIDYGQSRRGIHAAAEGYFHKTPAQLTLAESATLVGLVPFSPQGELPFDRIEEGRRRALSRIAFFFPDRYSQPSLDVAETIPLSRLLYPLKDAWDRHATAQAPPTWHGVATYFDLAPETPTALSMMHASLARALGAFLADAHARLGIVGVDHIGVYNDRPQRGATKLSSHAFGQAIDLSGFWFGDGNHVRVIDHAKPAAAARLRPVEAMLRRHFDIVVDWREDPKRHANHFHVEVRGPRLFSPRPSLGP